MVNGKALSLDLAKKAGLTTDTFLTTKEEAAIAEEILAREVERIRLEDREKAIFDLYGISNHDSQSESPEIVHQALAELDKEIEKIKDKAAYDQAKFLNEEYVTSVELRLAFLRSERFEVPAAARTMVYHFALKQELFGSGEILAREVLQSDLNPDDFDIVNSGLFQIVPTSDAAGRCIQVVSLDYPFSNKDPRPVMRAMWYMMMALIRDEKIQKSGVVWMFCQYATNSSASMNLHEFIEFNKLEIAIPQRCDGWHYCYTDPKLDVLATGFRLLVNENERYRFKVHSGTRAEVQFSLQTMGIPIADCPKFLENGTMTTDWHQQWLLAIKKQEQIINDTSIVIPRKYDVLFGKSSKNLGHLGNMRALQLVEERLEEYESAFKVDKTRIANEIVESIHKSGGRFLRRNEDSAVWKEVSDKGARDKISHWYRQIRLRKSISAQNIPDANC